MSRCLGLMLFLLAGLAGPALAGTVGQVVRIKGTVEVIRAEKTVVLAEGDAIDTLDRIHTAADGRLEFRLSDGTRISLTPNTDFRVQQYRFEDSGSEPGEGLFELLKGAFRAVTGKVTAHPRHRFEVTTRVATIGVRGTDFWGELDDEGLDVAMFEGKGVWVRSADTQVELDQPMVSTRVRQLRRDDGQIQGSAPEVPAALKEERVQRMRQLLDNDALDGVFERHFHKRPGSLKAKKPQAVRKLLRSVPRPL